MKNDTTISRHIDTFNNNWWNNFLNSSRNMSKPMVFKNCLSKDETFDLRQCVLEIIKDLADLRTDRFGYRVYENGEVLNRLEMDFIYDNPPKENETLEVWWNRVFGERKFGFIINQGERLNLELSKQIAEKISPLLNQTGIPTEGIVFTIFIGNYESTPLGIHLDLPGKNVIHFHLGPGTKTMYTWENTGSYVEEVEKRGGICQNNKDIEPYIPFATKSEFGEGDLFCMPEDVYHIGYQKGLSIGIACWCNNRSKHDFASELLSLLASHYLKVNPDFLNRSPDFNLKPDKNDLEDTSFLDKTLDLYEIPVEFEDLSFKQLLKEIYKDLRYSLHSNAGYRTTPFPLEEDVSFNLEDLIEIDTPYRLICKENLTKDKLYLYVRGNRFELNNFDCIKSFIDKINEGNPTKVKNLIDILDNEWDKEAIGFYILNILIKHHGIKIKQIG